MAKPLTPGQEPCRVSAPRPQHDGVPHPSILQHLLGFARVRKWQFRGDRHPQVASTNFFNQEGETLSYRDQGEL
jgi:hypothetical protein